MEFAQHVQQKHAHLGVYRPCGFSPRESNRRASADTSSLIKDFSPHALRCPRCSPHVAIATGNDRESDTASALSHLLELSRTTTYKLAKRLRPSSRRKWQSVSNKWSRVECQRSWTKNSGIIIEYGQLAGRMFRQRMIISNYLRKYYYSPQFRGLHLSMSVNTRRSLGKMCLLRDYRGSAIRIRRLPLE
jgi:hypothetical protein